MGLAARHGTVLGLIGVLLVAGAARLPGLTQAPPGLNQDEASNAWNAYCLLKTGRDQFGVAWPIFYMRALGGYRSTLFAYFMLPFQAVGGLNIWTTRLPAVAGGLLAVLLLYWVGARLFGRLTGLLAAGLLSIDPTHIQLTRWGHGASIGPLLTLLPVAALLWAGLPLGDDPPRPRPWRALAAGLLTGICCYGYPAARLYVPVFLTCAVLVNWGAWRRVLRRSWALIGLAIGIAVTFGPLAYQHVAHPEKIGRRGRSTSVWSPDDPVPERLRKVLARYGEHFGPEFLYSSSDVYDVAWTSGVGFLPGFLIPCVAAGVVVCVPRLRRSRAARLLVLAVVLYPVGDCLNWHPSPNGLRSAVGLWGLMLAGAVAIRHVPPILVARRLRTTALALGVGLCAALVVQEAGFMHKYFTQRRSQWRVYAGNHIDLLAACDWLRPRLNDVDAVICTSLDFNQPYVIPLVALSHDPRRWFAEPQDWRPEGEWDCWTRYGKFYFVQPKERPAILAQLKGGGAGRRVVFILREQEMPPGEPADRITGPDGKTALAIYEVVL